MIMYRGVPVCAKVPAVSRKRLPPEIPAPQCPMSPAGVVTGDSGLARSTTSPVRGDSTGEVGVVEKSISIPLSNSPAPTVTAPSRRLVSVTPRTLVTASHVSVADPSSVSPPLDPENDHVAAEALPAQPRTIAAVAANAALLKLVAICPPFFDRLSPPCDRSCLPRRPHNR